MTGQTAAERIAELRAENAALRELLTAVEAPAAQEVQAEYAIRWAEGVPGLRDVSTPRASRPMVEMALEGSAFDGVIVRRTVTRTAWEVDP